MRSLVLLSLCSCLAPFSAQYLAEQSASKAKTQLSPVWSESGPPMRGEIASLAELAKRAPEANEELLASWGVVPHDNRVNPENQRLLHSAQRYSVQLDRQGANEELLLFETYSGELFVSLFSQANDQSWAWIDSQRLPSMALRRECRGDTDGASLKGVSMTHNAPDFLWVEVRSSERCASTTVTEKYLLLFALQQAKLAPLLSQTIERTQRGPDQKPSGEQIKLSAKADPKKNTLLLSGVRRMFPLSGGALLQETSLELWYYFDGVRYQK
jgi:hypothetical protein